MAARVSFFPKFFRESSAAELGTLAREVGADSVDVVVREGYPVTPDGMRRELPRFIEELTRAGSACELVVTDFPPHKLAEEPDLLLFLADHGVKLVRTGYFPLRKDVREALREARETIERLVPMCSLSGITALYQVHHGTLISSASAAWGLVRGGPNAVSVQLDTGNQRIEGQEAWAYGIRLLGKHLASVGIKDVRLGENNEWCELGEGHVDWAAFFDALDETAFDGLLDLMPFYDSSPERLRSGLARDVRFVRDRLKEHTPKQTRAPRTLLDL